MPNSTASSSRSSGMPIAVKKKARPRRAFHMVRPFSSLPFGLLERHDGVAGLVLRRIEHHLFARLAPLLQVLVDDTAELDHEHARLRPFAVLVVADRADDGLHRVRMQVLRELLLVDALR